MESDKYFSYFLSNFPLTQQGPECTPGHLEKFYDILPSSLLRYWQEFGFSGFGDGLVWLTDPIEWERTAEYLTFGLTHPDLGVDASYIPFARTAFGKVYFWTPGFGHSLVIEPMYGNVEFRRPPRTDPSDDALRSFFSSAASDSLQRLVSLSGVEHQLFRSVYDRVGPLPVDRMYAFVPSLGLGGPPKAEAAVAHTIHVHLEMLRDFAGSWDTSGENRGSVLSRHFYSWLQTQPGEARVDVRAWLSTLPHDLPIVQRYAEIDHLTEEQINQLNEEEVREASANAREVYARLAALLNQPYADPFHLHSSGIRMASVLVENFSDLPRDASDLMASALERAGNAGVSDAFCKLGYLYLHGGTWRSPGLKEDTHKAIEMLRKADTLGAPEANLILADAIYKSRVQSLADEAWIRIIRFAESEPDNPDALILIGYMLQGGFGTAADPRKAESYFTRAAELGSHDGAFELALRSLEGLGTPQNEIAGIEWIIRAAELGSDRAKYNLGAFYATGKHGLPVDIDRAFMWYSEAAESGHAEAALNAAVMLLQGQGGLERNTQKANVLLSIAEESLGRSVVRIRLASMGL